MTRLARLLRRAANRLDPPPTGSERLAKLITADGGARIGKLLDRVDFPTGTGRFSVERWDGETA